MALPANVNFCFVTGRFIRAIADTADAGTDPDGVPLSGLTARFTSSLSPAVVRNTTTSPPVTIVIDPITCTTDADGVLVGPNGSPGVMLVASNDADLSPNGWTYTVTVSGPSFPAISFSFAAPVGGTLDLSTVVPVPPSPGAEIAAWQAVVTQVTNARDQAIAAAEAAENSGGAVKSVNDKTGFVSLTQDDIADGTVAKKFTATEKSKLAGVSSNATVNDTDANLRARSSHTGSQTASTISDLTSVVNGLISAVVAGAPGTLNTLDEIAAALGDDANFAATITGLLGAKAPLISPALAGTPTAPTADPEESSLQIANTEYVQTELVAVQNLFASVLRHVRITIPYSPVTGWPSRSSYIPAWLVGASALWDSFPYAGVITPPDMVEGDDWNKLREVTP